MRTKYLAIIQVETDEELSVEQIHEGLCVLLCETVEDGQWNHDGKFAVSVVYDVSEVPSDS